MSTISNHVLVCTYVILVTKYMIEMISNFELGFHTDTKLVL